MEQQNELKAPQFTSLEKELRRLLNMDSYDVKARTPDFILADYMLGCLDLYTKTVKRRDDFINVKSDYHYECVVTEIRNKP